MTTEELHARQRTRYRIGDVVFDVDGQVLLGAGERIPLTARSCVVLQALIERPGEVVAAELLIARLAGAQDIAVNAVTKCVAELRAGFGDSRSAANYIETVHKRGYRLVAAVERLPEIDAGGPVVSPPPPPSAVPDLTQQSAPSPWWVALAAVLTLVSVLFGYVQVQVPPGAIASASRAVGAREASVKPAEARAIALLAFGAPPGDARSRAVADRLRDLLLQGLGRLPGIRSSLAPDARAFTLEEHSPGELGKALSARYVLDARILAQQGAPHLGAAVYDARTGQRLIAYDEPLEAGRTEGVADRHAAALLDALAVALNPAEMARMQEAGTDDIEAYLAWKAAEDMPRPISLARLARSRERLRNAMRIDPLLAAGDTTLVRMLATGTRLTTAAAGRAALDAEVDALSQHLAGTNPASRFRYDLASAQLQLRGASLSELLAHAVLGVQRSAGKPSGSHADLADLLIGARMYGAAEAYWQRFVDCRCVSWEYDRFALIRLLADARPAQTLSPDIQFLERFNNDVVLLSLAVPLVKRFGDGWRADRLYGLLGTHDPDGYWQNLARLQLRALQGPTGDDPERLAPDLAHPQTDALGRGLVYFMLGDVAAGCLEWRQLDRRMLLHLVWYLPVHELLFPPAVLRDARYKALLEDLGIGAGWARTLRARVETLAPVTRIGVNGVAHARRP